MTWFRFADCPTYKSLSGAGIKECDYTIWHNDCIWLLEYKDFRPHPKAINSPDSDPENIKLQFKLKTSNSLLLLAMAWLQLTETGKTLCQELPVPFQQYAPVKLVYVVDCMENQKAFFASLSPALKQQFGYGKLLDHLNVSDEPYFFYSEDAFSRLLPELRQLLPEQLEPKHSLER